MSHFSRVEILGVHLYDGDVVSATNVVLEDCKNSFPGNHRISATGAHGLVESKLDSGFAAVLNSCFMNLADGMPGVWVARLKGAKLIRRCYGPDFFASVISASSSSEVRHFFCGGNEGVALELKDAVLYKFKNNNVVGTYCPPFLDLDQYDYALIAQEIHSVRADIVWVGLSSPKQEKFALRLAQYTRVHFIVTVGAAFDFHTGRVIQAPRFIQRIGMEWFFRLLVEPKRLYKRYIRVVPLFIFYNFVEFLGTRYFKRA